MRTIYKYPLHLADEQKVVMPAGAQLLTAQLQHETITIWALVEPAAPHVAREVLIRGTGHAGIPDSAKWLASVQQEHFVWHVFDNGKPVT